MKKLLAMMALVAALFSGASANAQCQDYYGDVDGCLNLISNNGPTAVYADDWSTLVVSTRSTTPGVTEHWQTNRFYLTISSNGMMSAYGTSASFYNDGVLCVYTTLTQTNSLKDVSDTGIIKFTGEWYVNGSYAITTENGPTNAYANVIQNDSHGTLYGSATAGSGTNWPSVMCFNDHFGASAPPADDGFLCWPVQLPPPPEE